MTDSTPDDKNLTDEATTTEDTVQEADAEVTEEVATAEAVTKKVATPKRRPAPPVDEDEDEEAVPVRRRPRLAAPVAATTAAGATLTTVIATVVVIALVATAGVFGYLYFHKRSELNDLQTAIADRKQAEKVAGEYAVGASTFDFKDLGPWQTALTTNVSDELKKKFDATFGAINQLLQPLQWVSKGRLLDAVMNSHSGPVYKVNAYVEIQTTNVQTPAGRTVVTVYNVTLDKDKNWQITDVGGAGNGVTDTTSSQQTPAPTATETATPAPGN